MSSQVNWIEDDFIFGQTKIELHRDNTFLFEKIKK